MWVFLIKWNNAVILPVMPLSSPPPLPHPPITTVVEGVFVVSSGPREKRADKEMFLFNG